MSTYAKATFDAAIYAAHRPTYPKSLFQLIFNYHEHGTSALPTHSGLGAVDQPARRLGGSPRWDVAVDLGCGTGHATVELYPFKRVIGVDPGAGMIEQAKKYVQDRLSSSGSDVESSPFEFVQSPAEDLSFLGDHSVDLVIAAQAAHWFDWTKVWPEVGRVLRPNGTLAFWIYSEIRLPHYPSLTPLITSYMQGTSYDDSLGPHWQRPGRTILDRHLLDIPDPADVNGAKGVFVSDRADRVYFAGTYHPSLPATQTLPVILRSTTTWNGLLGYFRSSSALHTYLERHPEDAMREDGNIAVRFWKELMKGAAKADVEHRKKEGTEEGQEEMKGENEVTVEWPVALVLAKTK